MKILHIGDVVGKPGRKILLANLPKLKSEHGVDFTIVNGENSAGGSGVTAETLEDLLRAGADVITTGDHVWGNKGILDIITREDRLLRPQNYPAASPGRGFNVYNASSGAKVCVCLLVGRVFLGPAECPFLAADKVLADVVEKTPVTVFEIHAEATSEKIALGWHLNGRASAVIGSHTHVQTADETVLSGGTAFITDLGMTGPFDSVIGRRTDRVLRRFLLNVPLAFDVAKEDVRINGVLYEVDRSTGRAGSITRIQFKG
jgi:hypothetical protein